MPTANDTRWKATANVWGVAFFVAALFVVPLTASAEQRRDEVLIYYANESAPEGKEAANYDTIIGWLRSSQNAKHAHVADSLQRDRHIFASAVDIDTNVLMTEVPRLKDGPQAVIVTNRLVRQGKCLIWRHGWEKFREFEFPSPRDPNYILAANPLSRPETMKSVLSYVANQFAPAKHDFILITQSHGSGKKAITPRLIVRAEETNREELLKIAAEQVEGDQLPNWAGKLGISKSDYFSILDEAGERLKMRYSLVYLEACNAYTEEIVPDRLPRNVDRLLVIREKANYINILYADILQGMHPGDRLTDALPRNLPSKFVLLGRDLPLPPPPGTATAWSFPVWVYFTPLGLWIGWVIWQWGPWGKKKAG
jgi:hypothetical protein